MGDWGRDPAEYRFARGVIEGETSIWTATTLW